MQVCSRGSTLCRKGLCSWTFPDLTTGLNVDGLESELIKMRHARRGRIFEKATRKKVKEISSNYPL